MSWLDCVAYWRQWHSLRLLVLLFWGISLGHVDGTSRALHLQLTGLGEVDQPEKSHRQTMREATAASRSLRDRCKNKCHAALLVMLNTDVQRMCLLAWKLCYPLREWHGKQREKLKSAEAAREHYAHECLGGYLEPLKQTVALLYTAQALKEVLFLCSPGR